MGDKGSATLTPDTRQKWHELVDAINIARTAYYQHDAPSISDSEYDSLFRELEALEERYPELASGESPTQTVGGQASEMFEAVTHLVRLYSLDNAFDEAELSAWLERVEKVWGAFRTCCVKSRSTGWLSTSSIATVASRPWQPAETV